MFGSDLEPFLKSSLSLAVLQPEGKVDNLIDKLQIWVIGLAKTDAPSLRNFRDMLSIPAAFSGFISNNIFMISLPETGEKLKKFYWT